MDSDWLTFDSSRLGGSVFISISSWAVSEALEEALSTDWPRTDADWPRLDSDWPRYDADWLSLEKALLTRLGGSRWTVATSPRMKKKHALNLTHFAYFKINKEVKKRV